MARAVPNANQNNNIDQFPHGRNPDPSFDIGTAVKGVEGVAGKWEPLSNNSDPLQLFTPIGGCPRIAGRR